MGKTAIPIDTSPARADTSSRSTAELTINVKIAVLPPLPPAPLAAASCFSKTPPCPTLKNGRQPAKRLPENVQFTASLLRLAATNSSSEYISQTTKNSGEILKQLDSQGISFFISINIFGKSFADVHKKANWLCRIEWLVVLLDLDNQHTADLSISI